MNAIISHYAGLAVLNDDESADVIELYSAKFQCVIQSVNNRMVGLEIARRSRPTVVLVDGDLLEEYLQDFVARLQARWPTLVIIIIRDGAPEPCFELR